MYFYVSLHPSKKRLFSGNYIKKKYKNDTYLIKSQYIKSYTCQRPSSTKTRIKTIHWKCNSIKSFVRDHLPLKQGLRLFLKIIPKISITSQRPSSTKTRIKTSKFVRHNFYTLLSETIFH